MSTRTVTGLESEEYAGEEALIVPSSLVSFEKETMMTLYLENMTAGAWSFTFNSNKSSDSANVINVSKMLSDIAENVFRRITPKYVLVTITEKGRSSHTLRRSEILDSSMTLSLEVGGKYKRIHAHGMFEILAIAN